jgi:hypothetical protein
MSEKKHQHVVPQSYQKSWCAPDCPPDFEPYVWVVSRDGSEKKRKAPKNVFAENEKYTIRPSDGSRNLVVEDTLMHTEDGFLRVLPKIQQRNKLETRDIAALCIFTAAMFARTNMMGRQFIKFLGDIHELVVKGERTNNALAGTSLETADMAQHAHQRMIQATLETLPQMLFRMSLAVLDTDDELGFITSDTPCIWFNPDSHKLPPALRSPNLSDPRIEISIPLTPRHTLLFSHSHLRGYARATPQYVDELNWRVRRGCSEQFISWKGEIKPSWLEAGVLPDDAWENTAEGKHSLREAKRQREAMEAWKKAHEKLVGESSPAQDDMNL